MGTVLAAALGSLRPTACAALGFTLSLFLFAHGASADPDLPGATHTLETIPANSLIIAMDGKQNTGSPFNIKAYGLVKELLKNGIRVKWAIANLTGSNPTAKRVIYLFDRRKD